ncbi:MAG: hypothetical protein LHW48_09940 [Candidatus Cloacimonetes bacterium]|nr:hypothetical protein [Candidatus Cloacimonadota bacterium]
MGWQALFATKTEGLFFLANPSPLPNGAWRPKRGSPKALQHGMLVLKAACMQRISLCNLADSNT